MATSKKRKRLSKKQQKKLYTKRVIAASIKLSVIIILLIGTSYVLFEKRNNVSIDSVTASYLSFNFSDNDTNVINMSAKLPVSDEVGKKSCNKGECFEFSISNENDDKTEYQVLVETLTSNIDLKYIKVYLTDDDNNPIGIFNKKIPTLVDFVDCNSNGDKIIYKGNINKDKIKNFKLKLWVSEDYNSEDTPVLSFRVSVK